MVARYFSLAVKNLERRGLRSWLTLLGIFIGIAAVVSLISLSGGLKTAIIGQFGALSTDKLTITSSETGFGPPGSTAIKKLNENDIKIIEEVRGVKIVVPRLLRAVKMDYNEITGFFFAVSNPVEEDKIELIYESMSLEPETGRLLTKEDRGKLLLGNEFSKIKTFDKDIEVGKIVKIAGEPFEVIGILKATSTFQVNSAIIIPEEDLKRILNIEDEYDIIVAQIEESYDIEEVADNIENAMRKDRNLEEGEEDFSVQTPLAALSGIETILNIINVIVIGIAAISLLVGGIGIANTMYTSVLERTKEIGVMKAIGARNEDIRAIFLIEASLLGLIGGIIGILLGLGLAFGIAAGVNSALGSNLFIVSLSWKLILFSLGFSFFVGVISGMLPAIQASKLKPVDALRS